MTKLVTGIGGLFFRSADPQKMAQWYADHFGINNMKTNEPWQQEAGMTVFAPFKKDTTYFGSMSQPFMLNLRVSNLDKLLEQLREAGVKIDEKRQDEDYGRFAWVYDPEDNKIELWEPLDPAG